LVYVVEKPERHSFVGTTPKRNTLGCFV